MKHLSLITVCIARDKQGLLTNAHAAYISELCIDFGMTFLVPRHVNCTTLIPLSSEDHGRGERMGGVRDDD